MFSVYNFSHQKNSVKRLHTTGKTPLYKYSFVFYNTICAVNQTLIYLDDILHSPPMNAPSSYRLIHLSLQSFCSLAKHQNIQMVLDEKPLEIDKSFIRRFRSFISHFLSFLKQWMVWQTGNAVLLSSGATYLILSRFSLLASIQLLAAFWYTNSLLVQLIFVCHIINEILVSNLRREACLFINLPDSFLASICLLGFRW